MRKFTRGDLEGPIGSYEGFSLLLMLMVSCNINPELNIIFYHQSSTKKENVMGIGWGITFITALLSFKSLMAGDHSLTVIVDGLRNSKGLVQFALYDQADAFPDEDFENHYKLRKAEITDSSSQVTFHHIPSGRYAVSILHDENNNGTIDKGLMLPEEGIGFTNYKSFGLGNKPGFSKASFKLNNDEKIKIKVIYM